MGFVKTVTGKFLYQVKDFNRQLTFNTPRLGAIFKATALFGHFDRVLFTHRTTQHIRATQAVTCQHLSNLHDLFLVQDDAVGWLQYRLQGFMLPLDIRVGDRFTAMLTVDKVIYHA